MPSPRSTAGSPLAGAMASASGRRRWMPAMSVDLPADLWEGVEVELEALVEVARLEPEIAAQVVDNPPLLATRVAGQVLSELGPALIRHLEAGDLENARR